MSYNILNLPDGSIEGHKYVDSITFIQVGSYSLTSATPLSGTFSDDGIFCCPYRKDNQSYTITVQINGKTCFSYDVLGSFAQGIVYLPVRKGDTYTVSTNAPGSSQIFYLNSVGLIKYR